MKDNDLLFPADWRLSYGSRTKGETAPSQAMEKNQAQEIKELRALLEATQVKLKAADELVHQHCLSDETWQALAQRYSTVQLMEVVGLVGCYTTVAMVTRSFDIPSGPKDEVAKRLAELRNHT